VETLQVMSQLVVCLLLRTSLHSQTTLFHAQQEVPLNVFLVTAAAAPPRTHVIEMVLSFLLLLLQQTTTSAA
jgi:hypothetical protein